MESKQVLDNGMLEEFVALYLGEKDKNLERLFREKLGVSNTHHTNLFRRKRQECTTFLSRVQSKRPATLPSGISKILSNITLLQILLA